MDWVSVLVNALVTIGIAVGAFVVIRKYIGEFFDENLTKIDAFMEKFMGDKNAVAVQMETAQILRDIAQKFDKMASVDSFQESDKSNE